MSEIKPDRISFKQVFPTGLQYLPLHIGVEYPVFPDQDPDEVMKVAIEQVRQWNLDYNPSYGLAMEYMKTDESSQKENPIQSKDERIKSFIATINMCTSLKFLKNFEARVKEEKNDDLSIAYSKKHEELYLQSNKQPNHL